PALAGSPYRYPVTATDQDGDGLTYQLLEAPVGMTIDAATGLLTWTPGAAQFGSQHVVLMVSDARGGTASQVVDLVVGMPEHAPLITWTAGGPAVVGLPYRYQVTAMDQDGDPITFALTTAPSGMTINASSGLVSWTPSSGQTGTQAVVVTASDGRGLNAT